MRLSIGAVFQHTIYFLSMPGQVTAGMALAVSGKFCRLSPPGAVHNNRATMFSLDDCKRALGAEAEGLTNEEVLRIRDTLIDLAEIAYETKIKPWLASKK
jgi:hypothetical protein